MVLQHHAVIRARIIVPPAHEVRDIEVH
jgi:hypothetical protein